MTKNRRRSFKVALIALVLIAIGVAALLPRVASLSPGADANSEDVPNVADYGALDAIEDNQDAINTLSGALTTSGFLHDAALISRFQLMAAELAMERATNTDVAALAARIAADHKRIGTNLTSRATAAGVDIPQRLAAKNRAQLSKLQKIGAASFDQTYVMNAMENDRALLSLFRAAAAAPALPSALSIYAKDSLHVLNAHEQEIQSLLDAPDSESKI